MPVLTELFDEAFVLHKQGQLEPALSRYRRILRLDPEHFDALHLIGVIALQLGRLQEAADFIGRAVSINPDNATAQNNLGIVHQRLYQLDQARQSFERAISLRPVYAVAHYNLGTVLDALRQPLAAVQSYDAALALDPRMVDAHNNRGLALKELRQLHEAVASFDRAIALQPRHAAAHNNRGNALWHAGRLHDALASFEAAMNLQPSMPLLMGDLLRKKLQLAEWGELDAQLQALVQRALQGEPVAPPFAMLGLRDDPALQRRVAQSYARGRWPTDPTPHAFTKAGQDAKVRIGYYSADFHNHATAHLMAGLFELHDRAKFEVIAFSFGPREVDAMRWRLLGAFDQFIEVADKSDQEVASMSRSLGIDIGVDLKGYTEQARPGIFAWRAAPIQVNCIGYPGTMAADFIDYLIADPVLITEHSREHYTEKIVYLPHSYQVNDRRRPIADRSYSRSEAGLPDDAFVFCCFNNGYKILPPTFDGWMRILRAVEGSVLWLYKSNEPAANNLRRAAEARGVDPGRLCFAEFLPQADHLARLRVADLFLDTTPYNAHTTASDALWAGVPVLTCIGESFAARVAASLLHSVGLPELVCRTQRGLEALAIELALGPIRLAALRTRLGEHRLSAPLFDTALYTQHLEAAYSEMLRRHRAGLPADDIRVQA